jgi:hypothetical protein
MTRSLVLATNTLSGVFPSVVSGLEALRCVHVVAHEGIEEGWCGGSAGGFAHLPGWVHTAPVRGAGCRPL